MSKEKENPRVSFSISPPAFWSPRSSQCVILARKALADKKGVVCSVGGWWLLLFQTCQKRAVWECAARRLSWGQKHLRGEGLKESKKQLRY